MTAEKLLEHQGTILLAQSDGCAVWQFRNETGDGTITTYEIFSGVMLAFNDFHMERYECDFVADRRMLAIDHCREGAHGLRRERQLGRLRGGGGYAKAPQLLLRSFCCLPPVDDLSKNAQWLSPF